ncbi:pentatricopeptide repeat-containing protein At2g13600-like [Typha angustifolia]|uniref:pentatricopeptide repeat-containing protein At2g13600-like n=1 Tax=Typha angustifolia TaxID=59011 RepID=UPI003C2E6EC3
MRLEARKLHASLLKSGLHSHVYRCNLLLRAYVRSNALSDAHRVLHLMLQPTVVSYNTLLSGYVNSHRIDDALDLFDKMPITDSWSWNTLISGLVRNDRCNEAVYRFVRMNRGAVRPDNYTYSIIAPCCHLTIGRQVHAHVLKAWSDSDPFVGTSFVRMYAESGQLDEAREVFDGLSQRDLVSWNVLCDCYSKFGMGHLCLQAFLELVRIGIRPDEFTFATVLNELANCLQSFEGMQVHSMIMRAGYCWDTFTCNALLNLYSNCGHVDLADRLFSEMPEHNVVSWTAMISAFAAGGYQSDAFDTFQLMRMGGVKPNSFTFGCLIGSCASANALQRGKKYHALVLKHGLEMDAVVASSLANMYSKCGETNDALSLFNSMSERDVVSWNTMICGLAQNGEAMKSLQLFDEMVQSHQPFITPNSNTFLGVLSACSHVGLVHKGCKYFRDMVYDYSIEPQPEHYACLVDLLARAGLLEEAEDIILALPFEPDAVIWGALLGACRRHGNLVMAKHIAKRLFVAEPGNSSNYVLLSNMLIANRAWDDALDARELMCANGAQKVVGTSWIDIRGSVHSFTAGFTCHPQFGLISDMLRKLELTMFDIRYRCNMGTKACD